MFIIYIVLTSAMNALIMLTWTLGGRIFFANLHYYWTYFEFICLCHCFLIIRLHSSTLNLTYFFFFFFLDTADYYLLLSAHGQCHCVKYPSDRLPNVYPWERSIPQPRCPDFILQAQLIAFPSQSCPRGKPDKSMMWLGVTVDGERRQLNLFLNVERYYYYDYYDVVIFPFR